MGVGPHVELVDIARPSLERYALRHQYDLVVQTEPAGLRGRPPAWGKIPLVRSLLHRYDVVVWVDADAVVVDHSTDIADTSVRRPLHLVFHEIDGVVIPNTGVFVARRSTATMRLLDRVWQQEHFIEHRWWENAALIAEMGGDGDVGLTSRRSRWRSRLALGALDPRWNSTPVASVPRPAIVHLAGVPHHERVAQMTDLAASVAPRPHSLSRHGASPPGRDRGRSCG